MLALSQPLNHPKFMNNIIKRLLLVSTFCLSANALFAGTVGTFGNFSYTYDGTSISITGYSSYATGEVVVPSTIEGKPVTSIGNSAFAYLSLPTSVTIPNSVTAIGESAFSYCSSMTSVTLPNKITSIGPNTFTNCSSLTSVTIPTSVTSIGDYAFDTCGSLSSVTIPANVISIGYGAYHSCYKLTEVTIGSGVTSIGGFAFYRCPLLVKATFLGKAPISPTDFFSGASPLFTVYFIKGSTGFTAPAWNGYPAVALPKAPDIAVAQPVGSNMVDGIAKRSFGSKPVGSTTAAKTFTISNTGTSSLTGLAITKDGMNSSDFIISTLTKTTLAPGEITTFTLRFKPTATGTRNAAIHIKSNDPNENPFDINLTGMGAS